MLRSLPSCASESSLPSVRRDRKSICYRPTHIVLDFRETKVCLAVEQAKLLLPLSLLSLIRLSTEMLSSQATPAPPKGPLPPPRKVTSAFAFQAKTRSNLGLSQPRIGLLPLSLAGLLHPAPGHEVLDVSSVPTPASRKHAADFGNYPRRESLPSTNPTHEQPYCVTTASTLLPFTHSWSFSLPVAPLLADVSPNLPPRPFPTVPISWGPHSRWAPRPCSARESVVSTSVS